jgi:hypothetical protein
MTISTSVNLKVLSHVTSYRCVAQGLYEEGKRKYYLPCESVLGCHCAEIFEQDLKHLSVLTSVNNHIRRCPRGNIVAILGIIEGFARIKYDDLWWWPFNCASLAND